MTEGTSLLEGSEYGPKACGSSQKVCYGLGHVYNDLCAAVWFSYTLFYFQIVVEMDATTAGALIMAGQVADSMATPAAGWAVDWIGTPRAWHLTGTGLVAVGFSLVFSYGPGSDHWWSLLYYGGLIVLFQIGWAIVQIAHLAIITKISRSNEHSSDLTAIRYIASVCCNIFVYLITWAILKSTNPMEAIGANDFYKFKEVMLIITAIGIFCSIIFYCGIDSTENDGIAPQVSVDGNGASFLKSLVTYQVSLMYMSSRLYTILNLIYMPLYLNERISKIKDSSQSLRSAIATVPLVCFLASFLSSVILKNRAFISKEKCTYAFGVITSLIGCIWIAVGIPNENNIQIYCVASIIGIAGSATVVASLCLTARFVNKNGFKGGSVYSTVTFTDKLMSGAVVLIIQHLKCEDEKLCPNFYEDVLAYGVSTVSFIGLLTLITFCFNNPEMVV